MRAVFKTFKNTPRLNNAMTKRKQAEKIVENKMNILSFEQFPYLYLLDRFIPFIRNPGNFHDLFPLDKPNDFINFVHLPFIFEVIHYIFDPFSLIFVF